MDEQLHSFILNHRTDDVRDLLLHAAPADIDLRTAAVQISGWQTARRKLPLWAATDGILYPAHLPMEQCSSQATAAYKAELAGGWMEGEVRLADLTGGFGVDSTMMIRRLPQARLTWVERDEGLCRLARHNFPLLGVERVEVVCGEAEDSLRRLPRQHLIYIDPARRDSNGGRTVRIADCTPDVARLQTELRARADRVMVKLSPMLDLSEAERLLGGLEEIHVVSVDGECKELLAVLRATDTAEPVIHCINLGRTPAHFHFTRTAENALTCRYAERIGAYLYEPNASVLKAAAFRTVAVAFGLSKLHPDSHLYTSDVPVDSFPGRRFAVMGLCGFGKKELRSLLADTPKANLTIRNFPLSVARLRQRLHLAEGGDTYLFATTLRDGSHVLIRCAKY